MILKDKHFNTRKLDMLSRFIRSLLLLSVLFQFSFVTQVFTEPHQDSALIIKYAQNSYGWPALHYATLMRRSDIAKAILELYPEQATQSTPQIPLMGSHFGNNASQDYDYFTGNYENGTSALELAVRFGDAELVEKLLDLGANPNETRLEWVNIDPNNPYQVNFGWQPYLADNWEPRGKPRVYGHFKFNWTKDWDSRSILYWALVTNNPAMVDLLLEAGASLSTCYTAHRQFRLAHHVNRVETPFQLTLAMGSDTLFKQLLSYQASKFKMLTVDNELIDLARDAIQNPLGLPPLHFALVSKDIVAFKHLLELGFDPVYQGTATQSVLAMAVKHENPEFLELLLQMYMYGDIALEQAIQNQNSRLVAELVERYPPNKKHLELAVGMNHLELTRLILEAKEKIEPYPEVLEQAIKTASIDLFELLTSQGYSHPAATILAIQYHKKAIFLSLLPQTIVDDEIFRAAIVYNEPEMFESLYNAARPTAEQLISSKKLAIEHGRTEILAFLQHER